MSVYAQERKSLRESLHLAAMQQQQQQPRQPSPARISYPPSGGAGIVQPIFEDSQPRMVRDGAYAWQLWRGCSCLCVCLGECERQRLGGLRRVCWVLCLRLPVGAMAGLLSLWLGHA